MENNKDSAQWQLDAENNQLNMHICIPINEIFNSIRAGDLPISRIFNVSGYKFDVTIKILPKKSIVENARCPNCGSYEKLITNVIWFSNEKYIEVRCLDCEQTQGLREYLPYLRK